MATFQYAVNLVYQICIYKGIWSCWNSGMALSVAREGDGGGGRECPMRYLRACEIPQITCYIMFARAELLNVILVKA